MSYVLAPAQIEELTLLADGDDWSGFYDHIYELSVDQDANGRALSSGVENGIGGGLSRRYADPVEAGVSKAFRRS
jgi:hypothetical protein